MGYYYYQGNFPDPNNVPPALGRQSSGSSFENAIKSTFNLAENGPKSQKAVNTAIDEINATGRAAKRMTEITGKIFFMFSVDIGLYLIYAFNHET